MKRVFALLTVLLVLLCAWVVPAGAQAPAAPPSSGAGGVRVQMQVSSREIAVGERLLVRATALGGQGDPSPSSARLTVKGSADVNGPSVMPERRVTMARGRVDVRQGLQATWTVTPQKEGTLVVGPAVFDVGGGEVRGQSIEVRVVPKSQAQRPSRPRRRSWLDPWGPFGGDPFGGDPFGGDPFGRPFPRPPVGGDDDFDLWGDSSTSSGVPDEIQIDKAPHPVAFLRAVVSPKRAVVGQEVTLKVYAYGSRGRFRDLDPKEPSTADFLSYPVVESSSAEPTYRIRIGDSIWHVVKLREIALFPLRSGDLSIGSMQVAVQGRGYPSSSHQLGFLVRSEPLTVIVGEPPVDGRPPGYHIGDVGDFSLQASVEPREVAQGSMVSVTAKLAGVGHLPTHLTPPEQAGIEWLEPSVRGEVGPHGDAIGGERVFRWVVRVRKAGTVDLGELTLPYWNPDRRRYEVARATLGPLTVREVAGAVPPSETNASGDLLSSIEPRSELGPFTRSGPPWTDLRGFWLALLLVPLSIPLASGLTRAARALAQRSKEVGSTAAARARSARGEARTAASHGRTEEATSAYERAVFESVEAATGLKARGILRSNLARALGDRGLDETLAQDVVALTKDIEAFRFTASGDLKDIGKRAEVTVRSLLSRAGSGGGG